MRKRNTVYATYSLITRVDTKIKLGLTKKVDFTKKEIWDKNEWGGGGVHPIFGMKTKSPYYKRHK